MAEDRSWLGLDYWERVRWARKHAGFETARAAATSMAMQENTYSAYERNPTSSKHTNLDMQSARRFATKFRVRWQWLLAAEGTPFEDEDPGDKHYRRIKKALQRATDEQQEAAANMLEAFLRTGTNDS